MCEVPPKRLRHLTHRAARYEFIHWKVWIHIPGDLWIHSSVWIHIPSDLWIHSSIWIHIPGDLWIHTSGKNVWIHMYPILVWYINKMATDKVVGGWVDRPQWLRIQISPGFKSPKPGYIFLANLANFHVATILANLYIYKPNIWFQNGDI